MLATAPSHVQQRACCQASVARLQPGRPAQARAAGGRGLARSAGARRRCCVVAAAAQEPMEGLWSGEDFYSILGLHPAAPARDIKAAYYNLMREHHPDQASNAGFDSHAFCVLVNQIYQTLSDPDTRAMYDAIAGFAIDSVNPFRDTSFPADQVFVDEVSCIGCGKCVRACPSAFFIEASKYGRARVVPGADLGELAEEVQVAMETCPVDCIHWVTSPQLSLLESALAGMERVDAFLMLRQHRSGGCVFEAADRAWQKRQATIAALREQQAFAAAGGGGGGDASANSWVSFWSQYVEVKGANGGGGGGGGGGWAGGGGDAEADALLRDPAARRVAELASAATRALRRWHMYQRLSRPRKALSDGTRTAA